MKRFSWIFGGEEQRNFKSTGKAKVVQKKTLEDRYNWEKKKLFEPTYFQYMDLIGYDCDAWTFGPNSVIQT